MPWPSGPSATSSSTGPTPRPTPATGWTGCSSCGTPSTTRTTAPSASIPASSTGTTTSTTCTSRRWWSMPGSARPRAVRSSRSARSGPAGPSSPPTGIWPCSTSSTPSWHRTWSTPTPGWPAATSPRRGGPSSWPTCCARRRLCWRWTVATGATSSARSTGASRARPAQLRHDSWELFHTPTPHPLVPRRLRPGAGPPRARSSHPAHHRRAGLHHRAGAAAVRRHRLCPTWRSATAC